jgi:hypothetical protein
VRDTIKIVAWLIWLGALALIAWRWHLGFWPVFAIVMATLVYDAIWRGLSEDK